MDRAYSHPVSVHSRLKKNNLQQTSFFQRWSHDEESVIERKYLFKMTSPKFWRDSAGSFKVPSTKDGAIKFMCPLPEFLEIYTPEETFKIQTPETIDPARTNPHAMWVNAKTHDVGSSSPFIARTLIMATQVLKVTFQPDAPEKEALLIRMHSIKELLLQCENAARTYLASLEHEHSTLKESGFATTPNGQALAKFPVLPDLEAKCTAFLIAARRIVTETCQIPNHFWSLKRTHSSLEHLINNELLPKLGADHRLITHLQGYVDGTKYLIRLRNGQEHGQTSKAPPLRIKNFETLPTNQIRSPVWYLEGNPPDDIAAHMQAAPDFLLNLVEGMFVACIDSTLTEWPPLRFQAIDPIDPECPTQYLLTIDGNRLKFDNDDPTK